MSRIRLETEIDASPERCFELSLTVETHLTTPGSRERAVAGTTTGVMKLRDEVTWESKRFGVPIRMTSRIVEVDEPSHFVDEMQRGPFGRWRHVHRFGRRGDGTLMTDEIEFASPLGPLGWIADRLLVRRYMTALVRKQNDHIRDLAERMREGA